MRLLEECHRISQVRLFSYSTHSGDFSVDK